jgi:hypothetical protein
VSCDPAGFLEFLGRGHQQGNVSALTGVGLKEPLGLVFGASGCQSGKKHNGRQ